ncbi:hypothetical protein LTR72_000970 [Exophiala xenobiotica]|nr:hypothetical protein LTR72_000970 [Exophiala xenobiotica]KAK5491819.1 hypothetical protein LTR55_003170 [Exophiala xenobiotica]
MMLFANYICLLPVLAGAVHAAAIATSNSSQTTTATTSIAACAQVSSYIGSQAKATPKATSWNVPYELAEACHQSVPFMKDDALDLVDGLIAAMKFQSTLTYLKSPPADYPYPKVDLLGGLAEIRQKVQRAQYDGEIAFELDIKNLISRAHDGHLGFSPDGWSILSYRRGGPVLTSLVMEGESKPDIYAYDDVLQNLQNSNFKPSPVTGINGHNATEFLLELAYQGAGFQDLNAEWNNLFYTVQNDDPLFTYAIHGYPGNATVFTFGNGTVESYPNIAHTSHNFTGVDDGASFYDSYCNASNKEFTGPTKEIEETKSVWAAYPQPVMELSDLTMAGWLFNDSTIYDQVAVLSLKAFSEGNQPHDFQNSLKSFLKDCRSANKTHLIVDLSGNVGGQIVTGYELFKQLFPTLQIYSTGNLRATEELNVMGTYFTNWSSHNTDDTAQYLGFVESAALDGTDYLNASGTNFGSWDDFYGPNTVHGDNFTNLNRYNLSSPDYQETNRFNLSGYFSSAQIAPQPFLSENIILLTDGMCSSTCHTFSHLSRYQAKVKTVAIGGLVNTTGPMEYVGGVKGKQALSSFNMYEETLLFYDLADNKTLAAANKTSLKTLYELGDYLSLRSNGQRGLRFNLQNDIAQHDYEFLPLQFKSEAADCRLLGTAKMVQNITNLWHAVADQAFGFNNTKVFSGCVEGSTNQPSSLSGNATLWNNGHIQNVTTYVYPESSDGDLSFASSSKESTNAAGSYRPCSWTAALFFGLTMAWGSSFFMG